MAEPEIKIGVQADISQALQDIDKLGGTCERNAAKLEGLSFEELSNQYAQLASLCAEMGKNAEQVQAFGDRLQALQRTQSDGVGAFDSLADAVRELQTQLANGSVTVEQAREQYTALKGENLQAVQAARELNAAKKQLAKETEQELETAQREIDAYRELNEAARKELQAVEEASAKKAKAREIEKASVEQLEKRLVELENITAKARQSGHAVGELAGVKEQEAIIDALERRETAQKRADDAAQQRESAAQQRAQAQQQKADATAQAKIDNIRRAAELEVASIDQITAKLKELQAAYKNARQTGDKQGELQYLQQMKQALDVKKQKLAEEERAQKAAADAMEKAAKAAQKQAAAEAQAAEKVRLSTMNVRQLSKETRNLIEARRQSAAAGDAQAVAAYTAKIKLARTALRDMKNEANLARTALLGEAQAGMTAAQQLGSLAISAKDGSLNMANLANTIMSVSLAIKAGLGPIGWIMMAIQGLQMAWDYYSEKQKKATEAVKEAKKAMEELSKAMDAHIKAVNALNHEQLTASIERRTAAIDKETEATLRAHDAKTKAAADEAALEIARVEAANTAEKARMRGMVERHQMTAAEMERRVAEMDANLERLRTEADESALAAQQERLRIEQDGAKKIYDTHEQALQAFERSNGRFFTALWTDEVDANAAEHRRQIGIYEQDIERINEKKKALDKKAKEYEATGNDAAAAETRATIRSLESSIEATKRKISEEHERFKAYILSLDKEGDVTKTAVYNLAAENFYTAAFDLREKGKELNDTTERSKKQLLDSADAMTNVQRAQQLAGEEAQIRADMNRQLHAEALAAAEAKDAEEAAKRAKKAQAAYMEECLDDMQKAVKNWKTIGSYSEKSAHLSEEQAMLQDQYTLQNRRYELEAILQRDLDEKTRKKVTEQLEATNQEIHGLCLAMGRAKRSAERWLRELEPPQIKGKTKAAQSAIKRLSKGYQRAAQRAEKAARSGNEKQQAMAERSLDRYARAMSRNAKHASDVDNLHRQTKDKLDIIKNGVTKQAESTTRAASASSQTATSTAADMAAVTSAAQSVTTAQETTSAQIDQLGRVFTDMASATNRSADSIERLASIVAAALDNLEKRVAAAEQKVQRLETRV